MVYIMTLSSIPWSFSSPSASTAFHRTRSPPPPKEQKGWKKAISLGVNAFGAPRRSLHRRTQKIKVVSAMQAKEAEAIHNIIDIRVSIGWMTQSKSKSKSKRGTILLCHKWVPQIGSRLPPWAKGILDEWAREVLRIRNYDLQSGN